MEKILAEDIRPKCASSNRRKRILVQKRIQMRYAFFVVFVSFVSAIVAGATVFFTGWMLFGTKLSQIYPQGRLLPILQSMNFALFRNVIIVLVGVYFLGIWISHKLAGPLYRLQRVFDDFRTGNIYEVHFRKSDKLEDLQTALNAMVNGIIQKQEFIDENIQNIESALEDLKKKGIKGLKEVKVSLDNIKDARFKINT